MGGGLEMALLVGAATGAGTSAITGGDPLKGALFGALGGGLTSGLGGALGSQAASAASNVGANAGANVAANVADDFALSAGKTIPFGSTNISAYPFRLGKLYELTSLTPSSPGAAKFGVASTDSAIYNQLTSAGAGLKGGALDVSSIGSTLPSSALSPTAASKTGFFDVFKSTPGGPDFKQRLGSYIRDNPEQAAMGGGSLFNTLLNQSRFSGPDDRYEGPLKRFRFDPEFYRPVFAGGGGITDIDLGSTAQLTGSPVTMMARGGIADLGGYSDGGRLLKGPGDGMSDSIPARIGRRQPARLADGEFVVPADVVSHLGNGSTDAGAKQLYDMMDKVRRARTGNRKQGREINPRRFVPA